MNELNGGVATPRMFPFHVPDLKSLGGQPRNPNFGCGYLFGKMLYICVK